LFGYISYDAVRYFEKWPLLKKTIVFRYQTSIMRYTKISLQSIILKWSISFAIVWTGKNNISKLNNYYNLEILSYKFSKEEGFSNLTDEEFKHNVALAKKHCFRGDVFQLVLSRRFQGFKGDEFNVYRALRSINPSLIYSFLIMGF
jgi:anthranilate synthase component 1